MENSKYQILNEIDQIVDVNKLVTILELTLSKIDINTISEMARKECKSPNGISTSNCYRKIKVGKQLMVIKGVRDNSLPF